MANRNLPPKMSEPDDIERLMDLSQHAEHAPAHEFDSTFARLRQPSATRPARFGWRGLALAGMGLTVTVAVIALVSVTLSANQNQPPKDNVVGQAGATVPPATSVSKPTATTTSTANKTISATEIAIARAESQQQQTQTAQAQAATPIPTEAMVYLPITPSNATVTGAGSQDRLTALAINGGVISSVPAQPSVITRYGTITKYENDKGLMLMTGPDGVVTTVRLTGQTPVMNGTTVSTLGEVKVGMVIAVTGSLNAQGELEAKQLYLNLKGAPKPVGNPGYPDGTK